tara:strand:+ start:718 stop:1917 length:1200 start_codon:yes stop_codon:yes gene_type:complete
MVNYYLKYKWDVTGNDPVKCVESIRTYETKSTFIHFRTTSSVTLQIFTGMGLYEEYDYPYNPAGDYTNISEFQKELEDLVPINTNYIKHFTNTSPYILIKVLNTANSTTGRFNLMISNSQDKEFISASVRDSNLKLNSLVSLTRPTTDINLDILDGNITGFQNVVIKAKGSLTNNECLLMNSDVAFGYFDNTRLIRNLVFNSNQAIDTNNGNGARKILINGLDIDKKLAQVEGFTNGISNVALTDSLIFVNSIEVSQAGIFGFNSGDIRVYNNGSAITDNLLCSIEAGEGQSFNPQYEVPSANTLYITSMSVFGNCVDDGFIKIVKYTYASPNILYKVLDKFNVSPNMNYNRQINFTIQDGERIAIIRKSLATPQGTNDITIQLYGTLKLTNLDIQSSI